MDTYDLERQISGLEREISDVRHEVGKKADEYEMASKADQRDVDALELRLQRLEESVSEIQQAIENLRRLP